MNTVLELLKAKQAELRSELEEIEAAIEVLTFHKAMHSGTTSNSSRYSTKRGEREDSHATKRNTDNPKTESTIWEMARRVLVDFPDGLKTRDLYELLTRKLGIEIASSESLYATLSKYPEEFVRIDNLWLAKKKPEARFVPLLFG